jgi:hypothetical protein
MKIEEKLYKEKYLKKRATEMNYKMYETKPSYCSLNSLPTRRHGYGYDSSLARDNQGHETSVFCCENQRKNCFLSWRSS